MSRLQLSVAALAGALLLAAASAAEPAAPPANTWTLLSDGAGRGAGPSPALLWLADQDMAMLGPFMSERRKNSPAQVTMTFADPKWAERLGSTPAGWVADMWGSPKDHVYLPGIKRVLYARQEWHYSQKHSASGWLVDPTDWAWTPIEEVFSLSDRSADFEPAPGRDGLRLPIWGAVVYDAHNKEAFSFGGGGVWGRVGKEKEKVGPGDWIFDEAAKRIRRLLPGDDGVAEARKWYPGHCGTWLFSESEKKWRALEQPLGRQPGGRILPGMAYDAGEKKIVLFGGDDLARCLGDTWIYDCVKRSWSRVDTKVAPTARAGHAMVYVPEQKVILMAGGYAGGWRPLKDVWVFGTARGEWRRLGLDLPAPAGGAGADYDPKRKLVVLASCDKPGGAKSVPVHTLRLDLGSAPKAEPEKSDPLKDWHCKAWSWGSLLPGEWYAGANKPGDPDEGRKALAALPANTWVQRKPPANAPVRGWGSYIYDVRTHKGFAWGGGHSAYPGAEISDYDLLTDRWHGMAQPTNYNPIWLHGMVGGPPGMSFGGWALISGHARKSYGVDPLSDTVVNYSGDVYSIRHRSVFRHMGPFPMNWGEWSYQVAYVTTRHGLYGFASERTSKGAGWLCRANVEAGRWEVVDKTGPLWHDEHDFLAWDSKRDRVLYFKAKTADVRTFDFAAKTWAKEEPAGKKPPKALGDATYIPEMDAALMVFSEADKQPEKLFFYKCDERKWYTAACAGEAPRWSNRAGRDFSPVYDPELKVIVRIYPGDYRCLGVSVMRLEAASLKLSPVE